MMLFSSVKVKVKLKVSKNHHLRQIKNSLVDDLEYIKYKKDSKRSDSSDTEKSNNNDIIMTEKDKKEIYEQILNQNRSLIDIKYFKANSPLISIIICNNNGLSSLKRLFNNFKENIQYPYYEIYVIVNPKETQTLNFLEEIKKVLPLNIVRINDHSYPENINNTITSINGNYILFLNSSLEPTYGWLNLMVQSVQKYDNAGAVGVKIIYSDGYNNSFSIKHTGITFHRGSNGLFNYQYMDEGIEPFNKDVNTEKIRAAVSGASLLVEKEKYLEVGGLDESYDNGYEFVDLCLKLHKKGYTNIYSPNALFLDRDIDQLNGDNKNKSKNLEKVTASFNKKWENYLDKQVLMDKLNNQKIFSSKPMHIAFIVTENGNPAYSGDYFTALELGEGLKRFGWQISFISKNGLDYWYEVDESVDVLICLLDRYNPRRIISSNKSLIKVAWPRNWFDRWVSNPGFSDYDMVFATSKISMQYIEEKSNKKPYLLPIATNVSRFNSNIPLKEEYSSDYCFTGSNWSYPREIRDILEPDDIPYKFKLYGKNWDNTDKFKKYNQGFIDYTKLPMVYASTKIVIDDANIGTKKYGAVNSRVFDALACGALVLTNGVKGSEDTFNGELPVFTTKIDLCRLLDYYLSNDDERNAKIEELQKFVLKNHTYLHRSNTFKDRLGQYIQNREQKN